MVTLNAAPVATLTAGGPTTLCQGGSVTLTAPAGARGYQFLLNGQPISGATAASYAATTAGSYAVALTNASGCSSTSAATAVAVNPATTATFTFPAASFCQSGAATATPTIRGTGGGSFSATPAGLSLDTSTGAINPASSTTGTYTVTYSVGGLCPSTSTASVTIKTLAAAGFRYANASSCATGTTTAILDAGSSLGTFSSSPAGLSLNVGTGAVNLGQSQPGTYTVTNTVAAAGGCTATSATASLMVSLLPAQPTLSFQGSLLLTPAVANATYQFYLNEVAIAGATSASYQPAQNGSYTVVVTSAAGCASAPSAPVAVVITGVRAALSAFTLTLYPNPTTSGYLTVTLSRRRVPARLTVFNTLGQQVLTTTLPAAASSHELDLRHLPSGVYVLRATTELGTVSRRLIRE